MERYQQRLDQFTKALLKLEDSIDYINENFKKNKITILNNLIKQGLIQNFEFTYELSWKLIKDYIEYQGNNDIHGARDAIREAFNINLISNGDIWMKMLKSRNETSHTYNEELADEIFLYIINEYYPEFKKLKDKFEML